MHYASRNNMNLNIQMCSHSIIKQHSKATWIRNRVGAPAFAFYANPTSFLTLKNCFRRLSMLSDNSGVLVQSSANLENILLALLPISQLLRHTYSSNKQDFLAKIMLRLMIYVIHALCSPLFPSCFCLLYSSCMSYLLQHLLLCTVMLTNIFLACWKDAHSTLRRPKCT